MERPALGLSMWLALWQVGRWAHVRRGKSPQGGWETSWRGKPHISGGHSALITKAPDEGYRPTSPGRLERGLHLDRETGNGKRRRAQRLEQADHQSFHFYTAAL